MPRVNIKKKNSRGKKVSCGKCGDKILPGSQYKKWSFRYGGDQFRCMKPACAPRASDLTRGRIGEIYVLNERLEDACSAFRVNKDFEDFKSGVESIKDDATSLSEEFEGSKENLPEQFQETGAGEILTNRIEALEEFASELDSNLDNIEMPEEEEVPDECKECTMAEGDDRHKKDSPDFEHEFQKPEIDGDKLDDLVEAAVSDFEGMSCDCD